MKELNKDYVLFKLNAVVRQLTCMNNNEFESHIKGDAFEIKIYHFGFSEPSKTTTTISVIKKEVKE